VNSDKAAAVNVQPALRRCSTCGAVLSDLFASRLVRETPATLAMSGTQECAACRLSEYRRLLRAQYTGENTR
jgi:hypothetical protein